MENTLKILIVDDEPANLLLMQKILEDAGYGITTAKSGPEALHLLNTIRPDLLLLDIQMPGMNGFEVLAKIKDANTINTIPVIMVTAIESYVSKEKSFENGACTYLLKPITRKSVLDAVEDVLVRKP